LKTKLLVRERRPYFSDPAELFINYDPKDRIFRDGRAMSAWTEKSAEEVDFLVGGFDAKFKRSTLEKSFDGVLHVKITSKSKWTEPDRQFIACRTLTNNIKFQKSIYQGGGRPRCVSGDLINSLKDLKYYIVCDICGGEKWVHWLLCVEDLASEIKTGNLTPTGWNRQQFKDFLVRNKYRGV